MARIRTVKPEAFTSESLAEVTVEAERTFFGLLTQADDQGRHRDNAAIIAGLLWPLRAEHTSVHVEDDLHQLANAGLICRYTGCDGRSYLHIVTWSDHQKIDKPSQSRLPSCPQHHAGHRCGPCKGVCTQQAESEASRPRGFAEDSPEAPRTLDQLAQAVPSTPAGRSAPPTARQDTLGGVEDDSGASGLETPGQMGFDEGSSKAPRSVAEPSAPGSRILDPGSSFPKGRDAPDDASVSANELIGEYVVSCRERPPGDVLSHLGRVVKKLLGEGIAPEHVRAGLRRFAEIQGHPSRLPSLVNDAMNARAPGFARPGIRPTVLAHTAWTNPVDTAAAYAEEL